MSRAFSMTTLVGALEAAAEFLGAPPAWNAHNDEQAALVRRYARYRDAIAQLPELRAWASRSAEELNAILRAEGFSIQLHPWPDDGERFGALSIIDVAVHWPQTGTQAPPIDGHRAFRLDRQTIEAITLVAGHEHPLVALRTKGGERVCLTVHDEPAGPFELLDAVARLRAAPLTGQQPGFGGVVLPMVSLDAQPDIAWVCGLSTASPTGPWHVEQALQQVRFGMNEHGARAKEATAVAARATGMPAPDYVVDAPFLVWFERDGIDVPLFGAHIATDAWADPGDFVTAR